MAGLCRHICTRCCGAGVGRGVSTLEFCPLPLPSAVPHPGGAGEAPNPPFALPVLFHPPISVHPHLPAGSAAQDSTKGPASLSPGVFPLPLSIHSVSNLAKARSYARLVLLVSAGGDSPRLWLLHVTARCPFLVAFGSPGMAPGVLAEVRGCTELWLAALGKEPCSQDVPAMWDPTQLRECSRGRDVMEELCTPWAVPA